MQTNKEDETMPIEQRERIPLTWKRNVIYASGQGGIVVMSVLKGYFLQQFLLETATLSAYWVGTILLIQQIYDAVSDPIVGALSDATRSRIGRRRPWILSGVVPMMLLWIALWSTPPFIHDNQTKIFIYYLFVLLAFNTCNTIVVVPYTALITDVANDYNERTKVVFMQFIFSSICGTAASLAYPKFITAFPQGKGYNYKLGHFVGTCTFSPLIAISILITGIFIVEPPLLKEIKQTVKEKVTTFLKSILQVFSFIDFIRVCALYVCIGVALEFLMSNFYLYMKYCLYRESEVAIVLATLQAGNFFGYILWAYVALKYGKQMALYCGLTISSCGGIALFFITAEYWWLIFIVGFIRAFGVSVGYLVSFSMLADVAEIDLIKNNKAREGLLYSFFILSKKMASAVVLAISSYILGVVGYEKPESNSKADKEQNETVLLTFRLFVSFVPVIFMIIAAIIGYFVKPPPSANKEVIDETDDEIVNVEVDADVDIEVDVDLDTDIDNDVDVAVVKEFAESPAPDQTSIEMTNIKPTTTEQQETKVVTDNNEIDTQNVETA